MDVQADYELMGIAFAAVFDGLIVNPIPGLGYGKSIRMYTQSVLILEIRPLETDIEPGKQLRGRWRDSFRRKSESKRTWLRYYLLDTDRGVLM